MKRIGIGIVALAVAAALVSPLPGHAQTQGMERRQDRRSDRDDARGTRQQGRHASRDAKQDCKDAGGNRIECRHLKRGMKQDARKSAREKKYGDGRL
jgi:hypothetical protein